MLNGAINHYNSTLTTAYNKIATLEAEVICLWRELTRLSGGNIASKTKVPEPPTFAGSENKIYLYDWLSQIALYCSVSGIISDDQKIMCSHPFTCSHQHIYEIILWQSWDRIKYWFLGWFCLRTQKYLWTMRWQGESEEGINSTLGQQGPSKEELC